MGWGRVTPCQQSLAARCLTTPELCFYCRRLKVCDRKIGGQPVSKPPRVPCALLQGLLICVATMIVSCGAVATSPRAQAIDATCPASPSMKPVVYIASPYSKGDPAINTHFQCQVFDQLMDDGHVWPVVPLWSHFQHTLFPRPYEDWIAYDLALLPRYDACLRLNAEYPKLKYTEDRSSGADREVDEFKRMGKPVFYSIEDLYEWAERQGK